MPVRIERLAPVGMIPLTEVVYPSEGEGPLAPAIFRVFRDRAFEYVVPAPDPFTGEIITLTGAQHEAIEKFVTEKIATFGQGKDILEAVEGVDCRVMIEDGVVHEVFGGIPKYAQLIRALEGYEDNALSRAYPGSVAMVTHNFNAI